MEVAEQHGEQQMRGVRGQTLPGAGVVATKHPILFPARQSNTKICHHRSSEKIFQLNNRSITTRSNFDTDRASRVVTSQFHIKHLLGRATYYLQNITELFIQNSLNRFYTLMVWTYKGAFLKK